MVVVLIAEALDIYLALLLSSGVGAVSYTHLDVYKRQAVPITTLQASFAHFIKHVTPFLLFGCSGLATFSNNYQHQQQHMITSYTVLCIFIMSKTVLST